MTGKACNDASHLPWPQTRSICTSRPPFGKAIMLTKPSDCARMSESWCRASRCLTWIGGRPDIHITTSDCRSQKITAIEGWYGAIKRHCGVTDVFLLDDVLVVLRQSSRYFGKRSKGGPPCCIIG
jgi:hypothetical protein